MTQSYPIIIEQEKNGAYSAYVPGLAVYAAADTKEGAESAIKSAVEEHLAVLKELGQEVAAPAAEVKVLKITPMRRSMKVTVVGPGSLIASRSTPAKIAAARKNGARGGRPVKTAAAKAVVQRRSR